MTNVRESALALYDGGWRAEDEAELRAEYDLTEVEDYSDALSTEYGVDIYGGVLQALREQAGVDEE